jgi:hypothetical protein
MNEIQKILAAGDSFVAIEKIQAGGTALEIAERYRLLVSDLYWKGRDLAAVVVMGRAGIIYCLGQSLVAGVLEEEALKLRSVAKGLAYDLGSFTWPGWEEAGISPTSEEMAVGRDCARLNLRLAIELKKPADRVSMGHWLIGAHGLASGDYELAEMEFQNAQDVLQGNDAAKLMEQCNTGYLALVRVYRNPDDSAARSRFDEIVAELGARKDSDAEQYLSQLLAARRVFLRTQ